MAKQMISEWPIFHVFFACCNWTNWTLVPWCSTLEVETRSLHPGTLAAGRCDWRHVSLVLHLHAAGWASFVMNLSRRFRNSPLWSLLHGSKLCHNSPFWFLFFINLRIIINLQSSISIEIEAHSGVKRRVSTAEGMSRGRDHRPQNRPNTCLFF